MRRNGFAFSSPYFRYYLLFVSMYASYLSPFSSNGIVIPFSNLLGICGKASFLSPGSYRITLSPQFLEYSLCGLGEMK